MATAAQKTAAKRLVAHYNVAVAGLLGLTPIPQINIKFRTLGSAAAQADSSTQPPTITIDPTFWNPDNVGEIIHEVTHLVDHAPTSTPATEGLADAVRFILDSKNHGATGQPGWVPNQNAKVYIQAWRKDPTSIQGAASALIQGTFDTATLKSGGYSSTATQQPGTAPAATTQPANPNKNTDTTGTAMGGTAWGGGIGADPQGTAATTQAGGAGGAGGTAAPAQPSVAAPTGSHYELDPKTNSWVIVPDGSTLADMKAQSHSTQQNAMATYTAEVNNWGIQTNNNITQLEHQAAQGGWNNARFLAELQKTPEFQARFPGIVGAQGGLKMSPAQYIQNEKAYKAAGAQSGINIGDKKLAFLFQNNVSPTEFQARAAAISTIRTNGDMFKAFGQQLNQMGLAPRGGLSTQDVFKFVLGQGNQQWYKVWNDASSRYAGEQAGIHFGNPGQGYTNLGQGVVDKVGQKGLSATDLQTKYADLANKLQTTFPQSQIQNMGLTKKDLVQLEFGGPRQAAIAKKVQQITDNEAAFNQNQTTTATAPGLGAAKGSQQQYSQSQ